MTEDGVAAPLAGVEGWAQLLGQSGLVDVERPAGRTAAVIGQWFEDVFAEILEEARIAVIATPDDVTESDVPAAAIVGVVPGEEVHVGIDGNVVDIALAVGNHFESCAIRPDAGYAAPPV